MIINCPDSINIFRTLSDLGYRPDRNSTRKKPSFSRRLASTKFPRFHIYYNPNKNKLYLHLDQKPARYGTVSDHAGEYDGKRVKEEGARIKEVMNKSA